MFVDDSYDDPAIFGSYITPEHSFNGLRERSLFRCASRVGEKQNAEGEAERT
jgi:hypothetical protein